MSGLDNSFAFREIPYEGLKNMKFKQILRGMWKTEIMNSWTNMHFLKKTTWKI